MPPSLAPRCAQTTVRPDAHAPNEMLVVMGLVGHECAPMAIALARRLAIILSTSRVGGSAARSTGPGRSLAWAREEPLPGLSGASLGPVWSLSVGPLMGLSGPLLQAAFFAQNLFI